MAFLDVEGLSVSYGTRAGRVHALDDVGFSLKEGESLGIAGESACGKSTLGLAIMRMLQGGRIDSGAISMRGESLLDMAERRFSAEYRWKRISMIFQGAMSSLDPVYTIRSQFSEVLRQHGFEGDREGRMEEAATSVGLEPGVLGRYPHELSGGMKQRAVTAMALLLKPDLVIADEPTTALDVLVQAQIINLLKRLKKEGTSFIIITHDLSILSEIADKVGIMYGGQIAELGSSEDVYGSPRHPYTQGLLASIPKLRGEKPGYIRGSPPGLISPGSGCRFADRCPDVMEKCSTDPPKAGTKSGYAKCWLYE